MTAMNNRKTGLVLEGGAMRGMFTSGVLDVWMEQNICFDGLIGVSAGATFGCNYKSGQIGRAVRYNKKYCKDSRYGTYRSLLKTGDLYDADFCYRELPQKLDVFDAKAFKESPMEFYVVCTDAESGRAVYHKCEDGLEEDLLWIRASASLPGVSRVVEIGEEKLLDGGVADSIPIKYFEKIGYNRNVVILTQPMEYRKTKNQLLPLFRVILRKYPKLIQAMANRHIGYNETIEYIRKEEQFGRLFVIRPPQSLNIKRTEKNPQELERIYQLGRTVGLENLEKLKAFMMNE